MRHHHQTAGETESVPGASHRPFVGQMFCDLLEAAPDEPIERLQEEHGLTEAVEKLPHGIAAGQVAQLVREEALLVLVGEVPDPFRTADFGPPDPGGEGHGDGRRSAEPH